MLLAETYSNSFSKFADIELIRPASNTTSNFWLNCLRFLDEQPEKAHLKRLEVLENAHAILHGHFQGPLNVLSVLSQVAHQGSVSN